MDQTGTMNPISSSTTSTTGGNGGVARTVENASASAHSTIDKLSSAARPAVDRLTTGAHEAVDRIAGAANTAAEQITATGEQIKNAHARLTEECRVYVRANPLGAVAVAFAIGFVLSRFARAR